MIVYRLSKNKYATDLSGRGAELAGGRWNSKGVRLLYTSSSRALCTSEIAVHTPIGIVPVGYQLITISLPNIKKIETIRADKLPKGWNHFPYQKKTQEIGDRFVNRGKTLILKVPSAVVQEDFNYLINPMHKDFDQVEIIQQEHFSFDKRLFQ